jgi:phage baseplate assembly protein W
MIAQRTYLGASIEFPFNIKNGKPYILTGVDNIKQSLITLLSTHKGSTFMLPEYGCKIQDLIFESNTQIVKALLKEYITEAINTWETRVSLNEIILDEAEEEETSKPVIMCEVSYRIKTNNELDGFVFPFYQLN